MLCTACRESFEAKREQAGPRFCSNKCRAALWRRRKAQAQKDRDHKIRELLEAGVRLIGGNAENTPREGEIMRGETHATEADEKH